MRNRFSLGTLHPAADTYLLPTRVASQRAGTTARLLGLVLLLGGAACTDEDRLGSDPTALAASGGGITVDAIATQSWQGGFNGAVRVTNNSFPAPITSFEVVFRLSGSATVVGSAWNGSISAADGAGNRTATNPPYLQFNPIGQGTSWDVGFTGGGTFSGSTIVSLRVNGQTIVLDGTGGDDGGGDDGGGDDGGGDDGGGDGGDTTPPTVSLSASASNVTAAGPLTLTATASDNVGVTQVEFRDGTTVIGTDMSAPYSLLLNLTSANNGTHTYRAVARDAAENSTTSSPVTVTVNISGTSTGHVYSTSGGNFQVDGQNVRLFGLNWFGMETDTRIVHGLWTGRQISSFLSDIKSKGFNALRLPLSPQAIRPGFSLGTNAPWQGEDFTALDGRDGRAALEWTLNRAQAQGVFVLLDFHTCDPARLGAGLPGSPIACSGYSQQSWIQDMQTLATLSLTYTNVVGIDLTNEPHALTWQNWASLSSQAGQAILAINPNITIWVEGVGNASPNGGFAANWGGNLFQAASIPGIPNNRLVFSPHNYGPSVSVLPYFSAPDYPANMPNIWNTLSGHLVDQGFTVITGEFGGHYVTNPQENLDDKLWQDRHVDYLLSRGMRSFFYWSLNPNSGDTGGVYLDDWITWNQSKVTLLQRLINGN